MTFFNPKEEVLDIQLTQYGRHLLSKGKMKPVYYAFFDEGVTYDFKHAGVHEGKNSAEARIQEETPWLKPRHCFTGRDEFLFDGVGDIEDRKELATYEKLFTLPEPLGTSDLGSTKMPYFSLTCLKGDSFNSSINYMTGTLRTKNITTGSTTYSNQLLKIPQVDASIEYKVAVVDPEDSFTRFRVDPALSSQKVYNNGLSVVVGADEMLLLVEEGNATCDNRNFDVEVFEMTGLTGSLGEEVLIPLSFIKPIEMVENNILLDPKEARQKAGRTKGHTIEKDPSFVEYYFNVDVDDEIGKNVICSSITRMKKQGRSFYSPCGIDFDCPDLKDVLTIDIYGSDADGEDC
jgi:hypothetical protein